MSFYHIGKPIFCLSPFGFDSWSPVSPVLTTFEVNCLSSWADENSLCLHLSPIRWRFSLIVSLQNGHETHDGAAAFTTIQSLFPKSCSLPELEQLVSFGISACYQLVLIQEFCPMCHVTRTANFHLLQGSIETLKEPGPCWLCLL